MATDLWAAGLLAPPNPWHQTHGTGFAFNPWTDGASDAVPRLTSLPGE